MLIVHKDTLIAGFGAEISAVIACEAFSDLDAPIQRLATLDIPIPYNVSLMESVILSKERIQMNIKELLDF